MSRLKEVTDAFLSGQLLLPTEDPGYVAQVSHSWADCPGNEYYILGAVVVAVMLMGSLLQAVPRAVKSFFSTKQIMTVGMSMNLSHIRNVAAVAMLLCLSWLPRLEILLKDRSNHFEVHLELNSSVSLQDFVTVIRRLGLSIDEIEQNPAYVGSGLAVYSIAISVSNEMLKKYKTHKEIIEALRTLDFVSHIEEMHN